MNVRISAIFVILLVMGGFVNAATIDIDDITVTLSTEDDIDTADDDITIDVGEDFYVFIELESPEESEDDVKVDVKIEIDGVVVYEERETVDLEEDVTYLITISSEDFEEDDVWVDNLMAYDCDNKKVKVTVSKDVSTESDDAELEIEGEELEVKITPESPSPSDDITVVVTDDDDEELEDIEVKFTHLGDDSTWDKDDEYLTEETDDDGEVSITLSSESEFDDDPFGTYQVDVYEKGGAYCKVTRTIDARSTLKINSVTPENPMVGQDIKVLVTDQNGKAIPGVKVAISNKDMGVVTYKTDAGGYIVFRLNMSGSFGIIATGDGYIDSQIKTVTVNPKGSLNVQANPSKVEIEKTVEIKVLDGDGKALKDAEITITKPDASTEQFMTPESGSIMYTPKSTGTYNIRARVPTFTDQYTEFTVYNVFSVSFSERLFPLADITVTVRDRTGKAVTDADVRISEANIAGKSDVNGMYTFRVQNPGKYSVAVSKEGFMESKQQIDIRGALSFKISNRKPDIGETVNFVVQDTEGNTLTSQQIVIKKPNGQTVVVTDNFVPEEPGNYTATASREGYETAETSFEVSAYPLLIESDLSDGKLTLTATSDGSPVPDLLISLVGPGASIERVTDINGQAVIDVYESNLTGNITIENSDPRYVSDRIIVEVEPRSSEDTLTLLLILIILIVLIIAVVAITTKSEGNRRKKSKGIPASEAPAEARKTVPKGGSLLSGDTKKRSRLEK